MTTKLTTDYSKHLIDLLIITVDKCDNIYGIAPCTATGSSGNECYLSWPTCQDRENFVRTTEDIQFCSVNSTPFKGGDIYEPIIKRLKASPTDTEKNKTVKARLNVTLENYRADGLADALWADPYPRTRPSYAGTRLRKLTARNINLKHRPIRRLLGAEGDLIGDYTETFNGVIYDIKEAANGDLTIDAEDMLTRMEEIYIPPKQENSLVLDISAAIDIMTVQDATLLPTGPNYIYIDEELIRYTTKSDVTNVLTGCSRGQEGTVAATHDLGQKVQRVQWWDFQDVFDILLDILDQCGYTAPQIDSVAFAFWQDFPGPEPIEWGGWIEEPTKASKIYFDYICKVLDLRSWVGEDLKITISRNVNQPERTLTPVTESANILVDSQRVDLNLKAIRTRATYYWNLKVGGKIGDDEDFGNIVQRFDADAESDNGYGEILDEELRTPLLRLGGTDRDLVESYVADLAYRRIARYVDPMPIVPLQVHIKDFEIKTGDFARITTDKIENPDGSGLNDIIFRVIRRTEQGAKVGYAFIKDPAQKFAFLAPDEAPADFSDAIGTAWEDYAYLAGDNGFVPDGVSEQGSPPYIYY